MRWQDFLFEIGVRTEKQRIDIEYDRAWLFKVKRKLEGCDPNSFFIAHQDVVKAVIQHLILPLIMIARPLILVLSVGI